MFGNDGKLYFTTGDEVNAPGDSQILTSPRGKILRINPDGTVPTTTRSTTAPVRTTTRSGRTACATRSARSTTRRPAACTSATSAATSTRPRPSTSTSAPRGANYAWPNCESNCASPPYTNGIYNYAHNGARSCRRRRLRLPRQPVPELVPGQLLLRRLRAELDQAADASTRPETSTASSTSSRPTDRSTGPLRRQRHRPAAGPGRALYYLDIGFDDNTDNVVTPKIRRIRYVWSNQPPVAAASADQHSGHAAAHRQLLERGLLRPGGSAALVQLDFGDGRPRRRRTRRTRTAARAATRSG